MDRSASVVLFGDEVGLPTIARALGTIGCVAMIVDPKRPDAKHTAESLPCGGVTLEHPDRYGRAEFVQHIAAKGPVLGVVCSYSRILWPELLAVFPNGVVNLHNAKLPTYRGANVLQWTIINGEEKTAATLHYLDQGIDTGPIVAEIEVPIDPSDTALSLRHRLMAADDKLLTEWLPRLVRDRVASHPQDESRAQTWPRRRPADGNIDWRQSDHEISNLTRALVPPWPGAFYHDSSGRQITVPRPLSPAEVGELRRELGQ
jgi:methionyl-tRNA formyltransferase